MLLDRYILKVKKNKTQSKKIKVMKENKAQKQQNQTFIDKYIKFFCSTESKAEFNTENFFLAFKLKPPIIA